MNYIGYIALFNHLKTMSNISLRLSSYSEANASELLENLKEILPLYIDVIRRIKYYPSRSIESNNAYFKKIFTYFQQGKYIFKTKIT